jgi:serine phosphatase RsbU (regulator of sigma subunit)
LELPDNLPSLSDFLASDPSKVPRGIVRRTSKCFGGQAALLLLDIDALYMHPTAVYPVSEEEAEEDVEPLEVGVVPMSSRDHTLSRAVFDRLTITLHREEWRGAAPLSAEDDEHLAVIPVQMADEMVGVLVLSSDEEFSEATLQALEYVASQAGAALGIAERYSDSVWRARRRIKPSLAAQVQNDLLPPQEHYTKKISIAGRIEPAYDVGGDFYDYATTDGRMFVVVADVSGKGLQAEHLANTTFGSIRKARRDGEELPQIAAAAHRTLEATSPVGWFATMLMAHIDTDTREMELLVAGHLPPILVPPDPERPPASMPISSRNPPVGAIRGEKAGDYVSERHRLQAGSRLLLYSDGITERRDDAGQMLGEEGLVILVEKARELDPLPFVHDLLRQVAERSSAPLGDDATTVIVDL